MKSKKAFDCVQMKWDIQKKLLQEQTGLSLGEITSRMMKDAERLPWLKKLLQKSRRPESQLAD